jgi:thiol:disulfide interchange protein DsbD
VKSIRVLLLFVLAGWLSAAATAQTSADVVKIKTGEEVYKIRRGSAAKIEVMLEIDDDYHINSNRPTDENLIATALALEPIKGLSTTRVVYPKAKMQKFDFSDKPLAVFDGETVLSFTARALPRITAGKHTIRAKLTVQACDHERCLRPKTVDVEIPVEVR